MAFGVGFPWWKQLGRPGLGDKGKNSFRILLEVASLLKGEKKRNKTKTKLQSQEIMNKLKRNSEMSLECLPLSSSNCNSALMGGERGSIGSAFCPPHSSFCDSVLLSIPPPTPSSGSLGSLEWAAPGLCTLDKHSANRTDSQSCIPLSLSLWSLSCLPFPSQTPAAAES